MLLPYLNKDLIEAGCDEAAAVAWQDQCMLPPSFFLEISRMSC